MNLDIAKYLIVANGIAFLAGAMLWAQSNLRFLAQASTAQGTVIALQPDGHDIAKAPVVRFQAANGETIEFTLDTRSNPPGYTRGQQVEVLYHAAAPRDAKINGFGALWGFPIGLGCFGLVFLLVGGAIVLAARKRTSTAV